MLHMLGALQELACRLQQMQSSRQGRTLDLSLLHVEQAEVVGAIVVGAAKVHGAQVAERDQVLAGRVRPGVLVEELVGLAQERRLRQDAGAALRAARATAILLCSCCVLEARSDTLHSRRRVPPRTPQVHNQHSAFSCTDAQLAFEMPKTGTQFE